MTSMIAALRPSDERAAAAGIRTATSAACRKVVMAAVATRIARNGAPRASTGCYGGFRAMGMQIVPGRTQHTAQCRVKAPHGHRLAAVTV